MLTDDDRIMFPLLVFVNGSQPGPAGRHVRSDEGRGPRGPEDTPFSPCAQLSVHALKSADRQVDRAGGAGCASLKSSSPLPPQPAAASVRERRPAGRVEAAAPRGGEERTRTNPCQR